jgi:hypothetical protein
VLSVLVVSKPCSSVVVFAGPPRPPISHPIHPPRVVATYSRSVLA